MPLESLNPEMMINMVQNDIPQCSPKSTPPPPRKSSVSYKLRPMVRLTTRTQVRILPNTFVVVLVQQARPPGMGRVKNLDVMGYESFYMEYPGISVVPTTHIKINKNKAGYLTLLMCNNTSEEVVIQKSNMVALGIKSQWKVRSRSNHTRGHTRKLVVNKLTSTLTHQEEAPTTTSVWKTLEDTVFVGQHNTYMKPKVALRDFVLTPDLQKQFDALKEKYHDIFSIGPSDVGITDLAQMTINTRADTILYVVRPYKLALQHQDFLCKEIQALLDAKIIVPRISQYAAPCMVVPRKCKDPQVTSI